MSERINKLPRMALTLALGIIALLLGAILIYLQIGSIRQLKAEKQQEQQALAEAQAYLELLEELRDNAPAYRKRLALYREMIPAAAGEDALLSHIYSMAGDCGLKVVEVRFSGRNAGDSYFDMPLVINMEGDYRGILQMLNKLRFGGRLFRVDHLFVAGGQDGSPSRLTINASAFFTGEEAETAPAE